MLTKKVENALNKQIEMEGYASNYYLAAASWCDARGLEGCGQFLYGHANEERMHMMKIFFYVNDTGGHALAPEIKQPPTQFKSILALFEAILEHEIIVTKSINELINLCLGEKDHSTNNFLQWYVAEQHEEEKLFRTVIEKIKLIGDDPKGHYWIDKELAGMKAAAVRGGTA